MLTYPEAGATRDDLLPTGYHHVHRDVRIGTGAAVFDRAADRLLSWDVHRAAGFAVTGSPSAIPGATVTLRLLTLRIPCQVVYTVDEPGRRGFAYGTLPGHPERGEEAFLVTVTGDDVRFRIRAFSRPASLLARAGGPLNRLVQEYATDRYVSAIRRVSSSAA